MFWYDMSWKYGRTVRGSLGTARPTVNSPRLSPARGRLLLLRRRRCCINTLVGLLGTCGRLSSPPPPPPPSAPAAVLRVNIFIVNTFCCNNSKCSRQRTAQLAASCHSALHNGIISGNVGSLFAGLIWPCIHLFWLVWKIKSKAFIVKMKHDDCPAFPRFTSIRIQHQLTANYPASRAGKSFHLFLTSFVQKIESHLLVSSPSGYWLHSLHQPPTIQSLKNCIKLPCVTQYRV